MARFGIHIFWSNALAVVFGQLDKVIISRLLGGAPLGTYAVAQRTVMSPVSAVSGAVSTVSLSAFARGQNEPAKLRSGASRAVGVVALVVLPSMVGLAAVAEQAVAVVYGPQWEAAVPVVMVLAPLAAVQAIACVTAAVMQAMGRADWLYRWALANCLVGAGAMVVAAQWGLVGVSLGLATVVAVLTPFEMRMALGLIEMRLRTYLRTLLPHAVITAVMAVVARLVADGVERMGGAAARGCRDRRNGLRRADVAGRRPGPGRCAARRGAVGHTWVSSSMSPGRGRGRVTSDPTSWNDVGIECGSGRCTDH